MAQPTIYGTITIKNGLFANLPASGVVGEPFYTTDTNQLYIWAGSEMIDVSGSGGGGGGGGAFSSLTGGTNNAAGMIIGSGSSLSVSGSGTIAATSLTGTPTAPTPAPGTNNTQVATTAFVKASQNVLTVVSKSANYTLTSTDQIILATAGMSGITLSLPTAVGITGQMYRIKRVDTGAGNVTIQPYAFGSPAAGQTIDGYTSYILTNQYQTLNIFSNGSEWMIESAN